MEKVKKVLEKKDLYIQFSEEELQEMGWEEGQKLSLKFDEDTKAITLEPFVKMELDITEWPVEILQFLVGESCERDLSVNDIINVVLTNYINEYSK